MHQVEELTIKILDIQKAMLGENHPDTCSTLINLAEIYNSSDRYEKAMELYPQTLELKRAVYGSSDHPDILTAMSNLATAYSNVCCWDMAAPLKVHVLDGRKKMLGVFHISTLVAMGNLAVTY